MIEQNQEFGSVWTENKLDAVEDYLKSYTTIMKNQRWARLFYLDAFAGNGHVVLKDGRITDGSAIRALKYPFDKFFFFDSNKQHLDTLKAKVSREHPEKSEIVFYANQDSNDSLMTIDSVDWRKMGWRGVVFLDPFAMQLNWDSLNRIAKTEILDVWYFFPLGALNRMLVKTGIIDESWQRKLTSFLGTNEWMSHIYRESQQQVLFGDTDKEKLSIEGLRTYVISRLQTIFPTVSEEAVILRNSNNAPLFLLCFMGSNPSKAAHEVSLQVANHLLLRLKGV